MKKSVMILCLLSFSVSLIANGIITVHVVGIRPDMGSSVAVSLYNSENGYTDSDPTIRFVNVLPEEAEEYTFSLPSLEPGEYMILGLHDANDNQKMDTGWFGIPKEGFFTTNDQKKPSWNACRYIYNGEDTEITLKMIYY